MSMEDETGIANVIVTPDFYKSNTMAVLRERFVVIDGTLQNKEKVIHIKAEKIIGLPALETAPPARNFH
jgi:error-prone DNA polymerase